MKNKKLIIASGVVVSLSLVCIMLCFGFVAQSDNIEALIYLNDVVKWLSVITFVTMMVGTGLMLKNDKYI